MRSIINTEDTIDSRFIQDRIDELEEIREAAIQALQIDIFNIVW